MSYQPNIYVNVLLQALDIRFVLEHALSHHNQLVAVPFAFFAVIQLMKGHLQSLQVSF
jgi:hypothetical protein